MEFIRPRGALKRLVTGKVKARRRLEHANRARVAVCTVEAERVFKRIARTLHRAHAHFRQGPEQIALLIEQALRVLVACLDCLVVRSLYCRRACFRSLLRFPRIARSVRPE
jgi:hypothetical protein